MRSRNLTTLVLASAVALLAVSSATGQTALTVNKASTPGDIAAFQSSSTNKVRIDANGNIIVTGASGTATIQPPASAGNSTLTFPSSATGTFAVSASAPLSLNTTTGNLTATLSNPSGTKLATSASLLTDGHLVSLLNNDYVDSGDLETAAGVYVDSFCNGTIGTGNGTVYFTNGIAAVCNAAVANISNAFMPLACKVTAMYAVAATAPTTSTQITLYHNGNASGVTCPINAGAKTCSDITHSETFAQGDTWNIGMTAGQANETTSTVKVQMYCH